MANPEIAVTVGAPDPSWHPSTFTEACAFLNQIVKGSIQGSYIPYVTGSTTPAVADQDKLWAKLDSAGRPLGLFKFYSGNWRRLYSGLIGEVRAFAGNPSTYFDTTGRGIIAQEWDGWALCNGLNGTPNLTDKFLCPAHMDNTSGVGMYDTTQGWISNIAGFPRHSGGLVKETLTPEQTYRPATPAVILDTFTADGNARSDSGLLYGHHSGTHDPSGSEIIIPADPGNTTPDAFFTLPPFVALGFAMFIGYA